MSFNSSKSNTPNHTQPQPPYCHRTRHSMPHACISSQQFAVHSSGCNNSSSRLLTFILLHIAFTVLSVMLHSGGCLVVRHFLHMELGCFSCTGLTSTGRWSVKQPGPLRVEITAPAGPALSQGPPWLWTMSLWDLYPTTPH